jgi:hypothetical protein
VTTTRIWYQPDSATSNTFDVPGGTDDASKTVNLTGFVRQENNRYRWQWTSNGSGQANVSMTNWPVQGNTSLVAYTFPGGGTIPATQNQVVINGRWETAWNLIGQNSGTVRQLMTFQTRNHIGGNTQETVDTITAPQLNPRNAFSPYQEYFIAGTGVTGGTANTIQNVKFFANTSVGIVKFSGTGEPTGTIDVSTAFVYTYNRRWEVNLHSATSTITNDISIGRTTTQTSSYFESHTPTIADYFDSDYAVSGYIASEDTGGYTLDDYVGDQTVTEFVDGVLAGLLVSGTVSNTTETTASLAPIVVVGAQSTNTCETAFAVGELIGFNQSAAAQDNTIETVFAAGDQIGITQPIESAATIETEFADVEPSLIRGFSADLSAVAEFADSAARNIIGITDGAGYITTDYAEADYFSEGTGLTLSADSTILEVDANIIRSDGTILFEGDFAATIQPGFQIDAGIVTQGDAAFEISPYTTAGTGLLFAAAAELEQAAAVAVVAGSLLVAAAQEFVIDSTAQAQSTTAILGTTQLDFAFAVASDSESRPSILAQIDLLDGTGSLTATALVDQSSRAAIELDTLSLQALAGYTLFGNTTNTIGINADFSSEGRIYYIDEYYLSRVERESRLYPVVAELHSLLVDPETRVNTTVAENTALRVEPETRIARPELLPTSLVGARLRRIPV